MSEETTSRRKKIITELLTTEFSYIQFLKVLHEEFYIPLERSSKSQNPILSSADLETIFQNSGKILQINTVLLEKLKSRVKQEDFDYETSCFADIFLEIFDDDTNPLTEEYQNYINNYNISLNCLVANSKNSKVQSFMQEALKRTFKFPNIQSYLITPIQRLPRYILILTDLNRNTPEQHQDKQNVTKALSEIIKITDQINRGKELYEDMLKKTMLLNRFSQTDCATIEQIVEPHEVIINEISLNQIIDDQNLPRIVIILTNHLIIAKNKKKSGENLNLCSCLSILSCDVKIEGESIRLKSIDRINTPPFIKPKIYEFEMINSTKNNSWKFSLQDTIKQQTKDSTALLDRAARSREHLQEVLLTPKFLKVLSTGTDVLSFEKSGKVLVVEGDKMDSIFIVQNGSVDVIKEIEGKPTVLISMAKGDIIGDISFIQSLKTKEHGNSTASLVVSKPDTRVIKITHETLKSKFSENKELKWRFYFLLCALLGERVLRINNLLGQNISYNHPSAQNEIVRRRASISRANSLATSTQSNTKTNTARSSSKGFIPKRKTTSMPTNEELTPVVPNKKYESICKLIGEPVLHQYPCKFQTESAKKKTFFTR